MWDIVQVVGALLVLAGFLAAQFELLDERSYAYLLPNALGSGVLAVTAVVSQNWGFVLLEGVWCLVSLWGLRARAAQDRSPPADATSRAP
jgi:hypothetical protein